MISPSTPASSLLLTGQYTRIGHCWVWQGEGYIHICDSIGGYGCRVHRIGRLEDRLGDFRPANGQHSGRQRLIDTGYDVAIEDRKLIVRLGGQVIYSHATDGDRREYYRYQVRGWRAARLHSRGESMDDEEGWWVQEKIETDEEPDYFSMSQEELRRV
jgi:hypothetical protein